MEKEMSDRIKQKIEQTEEYLDEVVSIIPESLEEYEKSTTIKRACERYFQLVIECIIDLSFFIVVYRKLKQPLNEDNVFDVLFKGDIISESLKNRLKNAKGMRNYVIHRYEEINDELVYNAISEELGKDVREFIERVTEVIDEKSENGE